MLGTHCEVAKCKANRAKRNKAKARKGKIFKMTKERLTHIVIKGIHCYEA